MALGSTFEPVGNAHTSSVEKAVYEEGLVALRTAEIPSNMQGRADYDTRTDRQPVYLGYAPKGLAEGTTGWLLHKMEYDVSDRWVKTTIAYGDWTNRSTASYS